MKTSVGVFFGGSSVEHEVSVISAMQAMAALDKNRYDIVPIYLTKDMRFYTGAGFDTLENYRDIPTLLKSGREVVFARSGNTVYLQQVPPKKLGDSRIATLDVAFPVVHGTMVEDGCLQGFFEVLGLPYVGCDVPASANCMDKAYAKVLLKAAGIPVLDCAVYQTEYYAQNPATVVAEIEKAYDYPVIVKPVTLGSSVGISKATDAETLADALDLAFTFCQRVLVERAVQNLREINCAVLGDSINCRASVCEEPTGQDAILSYKDKYLGKSGGAKGMASTQRKILLPDETTAHIQRLATDTFRALGCSGVARVDMMLEGDQIFVNEINTIPGSLSFYLWEAAGLPFTQLCDELIGLAFARARARKSLTFSFETNILANASLGGAKGGKV